MLNLLKRKKEVKEVVPSKTTEQLIEEIHKTFLTEVDRLLILSRNMNTLETDQQDLIIKCNRLKSLGFANTKEVKEAEKEITRLDGLRKENANKEELIRTINYFSAKYPHYKFITEESVREICKKYGLIYGVVSKYTGTVPDDNLKQMEDFKIKEEDVCHQKETHHWGRWSPGDSTEYMSKQQIEVNERYYREGPPVMSRDYTCTFGKSPLEIVASPNDFNLTETEIRDFQIVNKPLPIPDPIVLQPVIYGGNNKKKYYLIVTAWGKEASDELVVNEKMN